MLALPIPRCRSDPVDLSCSLCVFNRAGRCYSGFTTKPEALDATADNTPCLKRAINDLCDLNERWGCDADLGGQQRVSVFVNVAGPDEREDGSSFLRFLLICHSLPATRRDVSKPGCFRIAVDLHRKHAFPLVQRPVWFLWNFGWSDGRLNDFKPVDDRNGFPIAQSIKRQLVLGVADLDSAVAHLGANPAFECIGHYLILM
ncbi:hypothetical protein AGR1C_Cc30102 [Agrobacterium fabacearum TT111]|nr:hypothetical protein AGR1C_Cc30102 [Agrobacterium fabacearum TT111]